MPSEGSDGDGDEHKARWESDVLQMTRRSRFYHRVLRTCANPGCNSPYNLFPSTPLRTPIHTGQFNSFKGSDQHLSTYYTPTNTILTQSCCKVNEYLFLVSVLPLKVGHILGLQQLDTNGIKSYWLFVHFSASVCDFFGIQSITVLHKASGGN